MTRAAQVLVWLAIAAAGVVALVHFFPRAYPTLPEPWETTPDEAVTIALERFRTLGDPVEKPYVEIRLDRDEVLERRLRLAAGREPAGRAGRHWIADTVFTWRVAVYAPTAKVEEWTYRAEITPGGMATTLQMRVPQDEEGGEGDALAVRRAADLFLTEQGFDLADFAEPEVRKTQLEARTDWTVRYREHGEALGAGIPYGLEVGFAGDLLTGFASWQDDPEKDDFLNSLQGLVFAQFGWRLLPMLLVPVVGFFFLRRYHEGEVGVRRGAQVFAVSFGLAILMLVFCARVMAAGWNFGILSRSQMTSAVAVQLLIAFFFPLSVMSALTWTVGEVLCRERFAHRLAAFDALIRGRWANATVARASLVGTASGIALAALLVLLAVLMEPLGAVGLSAFLPGPWWDGVQWLGLAYVAFALVMTIYSELLCRLMLVSAAANRLGTWLGGGLAALVSSFVLFPPFLVIPWPWAIPLWILFSLVQTALFLRYGLATSLISSLMSGGILALYPFLVAEDPWLQIQGWLPLFLFALPLLVSLRHLATGEEFVYRWDDVPPHVRRIAERERQRVELETARRIQSSILPELPPQLNGVELAHAYLPATEVGGDFYDVLALEDGRLAVAVGDVAGHGVSSGLVMSMARSALAVQVTFNPEVKAVFSTLNRVVYQSARKRLLATLCYALLDPVKREFLYASAGHLYPYLVKSEAGRVFPLEFDAYPLGVRGDLQVEARLARLDPGDTLFLLSDGLVEAHPEGSDDLFGFQRLEESLLRHARLGVAGLRDAVLADVDRHSRGAPREDDQTVVVLRVP